MASPSVSAPAHSASLSFRQTLIRLIPFLVRRIENHPTASGDVPTEPCTIANCGQLDPSDPSLSAAETTSTDGDPFEDFPDDQDPLPDGDVKDKPEVALRVAREIREIGNKLFKEGKVEEALSKYQSMSSHLHLLIFFSPRLITTKSHLESLRYLDLHTDLPEDSPPELKDSYKALAAPLCLNTALAALRLGGASNAQIALSKTNRAIFDLELNNADRGKMFLSSWMYRTACNAVMLPLSS